MSRRTFIASILSAVFGASVLRKLKPGPIQWVTLSDGSAVRITSGRLNVSYIGGDDYIDLGDWKCTTAAQDAISRNFHKMMESFQEEWLKS